MEALSTTEKTPLIRQPDNSLAIPTLTSADKELNEKAGEEEDTSKEDLSHRAIWRRALLHAIFYFFSYLLYFRLVAYPMIEYMKKYMCTNCRRIFRCKCGQKIDEEEKGEKSEREVNIKEEGG